MAYLGSGQWGLDYAAEDRRWTDELGFGRNVLEGPWQSIMSRHLQEKGLSRNQAHAILMAQTAVEAATIANDPIVEI